MKCPLFIAGANVNARDSSYDQLDCLEEDCDWYQETFKKCSITTLADALSVMAGDLDRLTRIIQSDKLTYRCYQCGTTLSVSPQDLDEPYSGWTRFDHVDGTHGWLCRHCSEEVDHVAK